MKNRILWR